MYDDYKKITLSVKKNIIKLHFWHMTWIQIL